MSELRMQEDPGVVKVPTMTEGNSITRRWTTAVITAGCISAALGLLVLVGWYTHSVVLIQVLPAFVPMQYNTALGFFLCGAGLAALAYGRLPVAIACGSVAGAVGVLTLAEYIFGVNLGLDQLFMEHYITVETSHPGRMAPNTALSFGLTGAALVSSSLLGNPRQRFLSASVLGSATLALGTLAFFGYLIGAQTGYAWSHLTRMAVHTAFAFGVLGSGLIAFARGERVVAEAAALEEEPEPLAAARAGPASERRKIVATSISIMVVVSLAVGLTAMRELYKGAVEQQLQRLAEMAQRQARLMEAVARFDAMYSAEDVAGGAIAATLGQIMDALERSPAGIGETGEFTVVKREGGQLVFVSGHRGVKPDAPASMPFSSTSAELGRLALSGGSGTLIGLDEHGETVLAAYESVADLDLGLVVTIGLTEIRAPFVKAGLLGAVLALVIIAIGGGALMVSVNPLIVRVEQHSEQLRRALTQVQEEIGRRAQVEDELRADIVERKRVEEERARVVADLERFNRSAVGREERMIELKQQVNQLLEEASRPPAYDVSFVQDEGKASTAESEPI